MGDKNYKDLYIQFQIYEYSINHQFLKGFNLYHSFNVKIKEVLNSIREI